MIKRQLYLSDDKNLETVAEYLGMSECEIEEIVGGRFRKNSRWGGQCKGKFVETYEGMVYLKTNFGSKTLWKDKINEEIW